MRKLQTDIRRLLFISMLLTTALAAQELFSPPEALRGLDGVGITVHPLDRKLIKDGVTEDALQVVVKAVLEKASIPVLNTPEGLPEKAPLLETTVGAIKDPDGAFYIVDLTLKLRRASLVRRETASASERAGWERSWSGMVPLSRIDTIDRRLRAFAREFSKDYLAANRKLPEPDKDN